MKKNIIVCNTDNPILTNAVRLLTQILLDATVEYPVCVKEADYRPQEDFRPFFIGTPENSGFVRSLSREIPTLPEEYVITVENDQVVIAGTDANGVLYGCVDFFNRYLTLQSMTHDSGSFFRDLFQGDLPEDFIRSSPGVKERGLWTWGHVIYDYRGYIENMARLKLNTLIIWNDHVPFNAAEMIAYAHEWGIRLFWGFAWLWLTDCSKVDMNTLAEESRRIAALYEREYAALDSDGIYFQSFTELWQDNIDGVLIADAVTRFVNDTAGLIYEKHPNLELLFGLHANSVREKLHFIQNTDPRIRIVWENCGAFPFDYLPEEVDHFDETVEFTRKIALLRGETEKFGAVLKGLTKLDWNDFRHQPGPAFQGVSSHEMQQNRIHRKAPIWHLMQAGWIINADKACTLIREMARATGGELQLTALVEDGMFEKKLYYPVALLGEMLWDCTGDLKNLIYRVAARSNVEFA